MKLWVIGSIVLIVVFLYFIYATLIIPVPITSDRCIFQQRFSCPQNFAVFEDNNTNLSISFSLTNLNEAVQIKGIGCFDKPPNEVKVSDITFFTSDYLKNNETKIYLTVCQMQKPYKIGNVFQGSLAILYDDDRLELATIKAKIDAR